MNAQGAGFHKMETALNSEYIYIYINIYIYIYIYIYILYTYKQNDIKTVDLSELCFFCPPIDAF